MHDNSAQSDRPAEPALAVVMPVLNAADTIADAMDSLADQADTVEAVIADGGSTDGTVSIAERYPFARVLTAPGSSIYEALNLAVAATRAPVVAWLNADDRFLPGGLAAACAVLAAQPAVDIVRGRPIFLRGDEHGWQEHDRRIEARTEGALSLPLITRGPLAINSLVFRRALLDRIGPFDTSLRLAADREWMLRAWRAGARIHELEHPLYCYRVHRGSHTLDPARRSHLRTREEHAAILRRILPEARSLAADDPVRIELRRWHAVECALRLQAALGGFAWCDAARLCREAGLADPAWPLILAGQLPGLLRVRWADRATRRTEG
jgi:glycosyltransferase involved in cell wall biosynthesis